MCSCFCIGDGHITYPIDGESVVETTVVTKNPAVTVRGVFAKTDVGYDKNGGKLGANKADGLYDRTFRVICRGSQSILYIRCCRDTKEDDRAEAFVNKGGEMGDKSVNPTTVLVGERGYERFFIRRVGYEERIDEHRLCQLSLCLPGSRQRVTIATVQLAGDIA